MVELKDSHKITGVAWIDIILVASSSFGFWSILLLFLLHEKSLMSSIVVSYAMSISIPTTTIYGICYLLIEWAKKEAKKRNEPH
jgi:predicted membrane-bound dolichyl-phosphate-mannose-protein mannosyltransferase